MGSEIDFIIINGVKRRAFEINTSNGIKREKEDKGLTGTLRWYDTAYVPKEWHNINIPGYWDDQGVKDLNGVVWYRKEKRNH